MRMITRRSWRNRAVLWLAMALAALLVALVAAAGCSSKSNDPFLCTPDVPAGCVFQPREANLIPGEQLNVYEVLSLDRAVDLMVIQGIDDVQWVLGDETQRVLSLLDIDVVLEPWSLSQRPLFAVLITWPQGQGINYSGGSTHSLQTIIDLKANVMGIGGANPIQWPLPEGFVDIVLASASDVAPTPEPSPTRIPVTPPTPEPTVTPVPRSDNFFDHPEGVLQWDGPDERVSSRDEGHCGPPREIREEYGIPALVVMEDRGVYNGAHWFSGIISREDGWRWTGYYHEDWQIWMGSRTIVLYLINSRHPETAFEYQNFGCI